MIKLSELSPEPTKLFYLGVTIPVTTSASDGSFSTLCRLKTYVRSAMTQERLNHIAVPHVHINLCGELDLDAIGNDFI